MANSSLESEQKAEKTNLQLLLIEDLKQEIESARRLDPEKLAVEIEKIGFSCQRCGKCCRKAFGDNRVMLIPHEIETIREFTGLTKLEVAGPFLPDIADIGENTAGSPKNTGRNEEKLSSELLELLQGNIDFEGNIHIFGWVLRRKTNCDCIFNEKVTGRCRIYPVRPMLCKTYPFYIEELKLQTCECDGLGYPISKDESCKLAEKLLNRYVTELEDMLAVYENYSDFERGDKGPELARQKLEQGECIFVVHDSTGTAKIMD